MTEEQKRRHGHRPQKQRKKQELPEIFFCGDPHGEFSQILSAARDYKPAAMVILGDLQHQSRLRKYWRNMALRNLVDSGESRYRILTRFMTISGRARLRHITCTAVSAM